MLARTDGLDEASAQEGGSVALKEFADHAPVMIWRSGPKMLRDYFNGRWLAFTGRPMTEEAGMGWAEGVHPDDYDRCLEVHGKAFSARAPFSVEYRLRRHDGAYRWVLENGAPFERYDTFAGYYGSCVEIDDRKRLEEAQRRMVEEVNHRAKNILASVQAIAYQTLRGDAESQGAYRTFLGRLQAMAGVHDLVVSGTEPGADLTEIACRVARPHVEDEEQFRLLGGNPVWIGPKRALALTLCLHELFSNALQHGALSVRTGRVELDWDMQPDRVRLLWKETGGPTVKTDAGTGVGLKLIRTLGREGGGEVSFSFSPDGLGCAISFPASAPKPPAGPGAAH